MKSRKNNQDQNKSNFHTMQLSKEYSWLLCGREGNKCSLNGDLLGSSSSGLEYLNGQDAVFRLALTLCWSTGVGKEKTRWNSPIERSLAQNR